MQKLTPGANKANAILIRIVLFLIGGIAIITGMCLFSGDMWMLTPRAEQYQPATGDLVDVVIYEPSKFFFALLYVFIITLVWLLAVRKIPAADTASYITADGTDCRRDIYFPPPGGHPGSGCQYSVR